MPISKRSKVRVTLRQYPDLVLRLVEGTVVNDNVVGDLESFLAARLGGKHAARLLGRFGVARQQPLELCFLTAVDDKYPVDKLPERGFDEEGHDDELVVAAGCLGLATRLRADARMQDGLEVAACIVVGSPRLLEHECRSPEQMRLANGLARLVADARVEPERGRDLWLT